MIGDIEYSTAGTIFGRNAGVAHVSDRVTTRTLTFGRPTAERCISVAPVEKTVSARSRRLSLVRHPENILPGDAGVDATGSKFGLSAWKRVFDRGPIGPSAVGPRRPPHCEPRSGYRIRDLGQDVSRRLPEGNYATSGPRVLTHVIDVVACVAFLGVTAVPLLAAAFS